MSGIKISNLPASTTPLSGSETVPLVQGGVTKRATVTQIGTVTAAGATAAQTLAARFSQLLTVGDFGAVGDGTTDDSAAIQAALDAISLTGGTLRLEPDKTYKCLSTLTISASNVIFDGCGSTIDGSARAAATAINQVYALKVEGSTGSTTTVTSNIGEGDVTLAVTSTSAFSADDLAFVYSQDKYPAGATNANTTRAALHRVRTIGSATSLTLYDGTYFDYTTANGASVQKINPVTNVTIRNLTVRMGGANKAHCGIRIKYAVECNVVDCVTVATEDVGLRFDTTLSCTVTGGDFSDCTSPDAGTSGVTGTTGYGVYPADASRGTRVLNCRFRNTRHAVAGGGRYPSIDTVVTQCFVDGNRAATYPNTYSLDCHEDCLYWIFDSNHVSGDDQTNGSGGINLRGQKCSAVNNTISNAWQYGIYVRNYDNPGNSTGNAVSGNIITNARLDGIYVQGSTTATQSNILITNNTLYGCKGHGIALAGASFVTVSDNVIEMSAAANTNGIRLIGTANTTGNQCTNIVIANNIIETPTAHGVLVDFGDTVSISNCQVWRSANDSIYLGNCKNVTISNCFMSTTSSTRSGVQVDASERVTVSGCVGANTNTPSSTASGVYVAGASSDVAVTGCVFNNYVRGVYSVSPADYITAVGVNGRNCTTAAVDVSASANTSTAGNL